MTADPRRVVITGGGGFVGQWITKVLIARGDAVWSSGNTPMPTSSRILSAEDLAAVHWVQADVRSDVDMAGLIAAARPDLVIHLAGVSHVPTAESAPAAAYEINVLGAVRLLSAAAASRSRGDCDPTMLVIGSGTQYGDHPPSAMPLDESAEQRPASAYAATKLAQEVAVFQIGRASGLRVICARSFSHSGVGQDAIFLLPALVARVKALRATGGDIRIGNNVVRDYLHVDDAVAAYLALADHGKPGEAYNVCSGVGVSIQELAESALRHGGVEAKVVSDESLKRASDMPVLIGSAARIRAATGWVPRKNHDDIFADLFAAG